MTSYSRVVGVAPTSTYYLIDIPYFETRYNLFEQNRSPSEHGNSLLGMLIPYHKKAFPNKG